MLVHPGPAFSVADVYNGWSRALRDLGCEVFDFNLDHRLNVYSMVDMTVEGETRKAFSQEAAWRLTMEGLFSECYKFWPDVVLIVSGFLVGGDIVAVLQQRGHKVATLFTESPYEDITQIERAAQPDLIMVNDPTNLERFQAANPRAYYQSHCYDPAIHSPGPVTPGLESEFAFIGTGYESRIEFLEQVDWTGIDATIGGYWRQLTDDSPLRPFLGHDLHECVDNADTVEVYRSTKMSANLYRREAERDELVEGWAMGPREVELAATGTPFLTQSRGENRDVLPMVPTFDSPEEFGDLIRWHLSHDDERVRLADAARSAIADRTFRNAAIRFLGAMEQVPESRRSRPVLAK